MSRQKLKFQLAVAVLSARKSVISSRSDSRSVPVDMTMQLRLFGTNEIIEGYGSCCNTAMSGFNVRYANF